MATTTRSHAPNAAALREELARSLSATVYVDVPGAESAAPAQPEPEPAAEIVPGDPPLHVQLDLVRQKLAVRKATEQEVDEAQAAHAANTTASHASANHSSA